jgi:hypothetical protein
MIRSYKKIINSVGLLHCINPVVRPNIQVLRAPYTTIKIPYNSSPLSYMYHIDMRIN